MTCTCDAGAPVSRDAADLLELMRARRSLRRYRPDAPPRPWLSQILEAATWAPSAHNRQPWRFVIIEKAAAKAKLAATMGGRLRRDLEADGQPRELIEADVARSYQRITGAPVAILLCLTLAEMDRYPDRERSEHERAMAIQSTAMAGQNMLLMASSLGLGACWMCAPLFCPELVAGALDLPSGWLAQGLITLGFPAQQRDRGREPWESRALWR